MGKRVKFYRGDRTQYNTSTDVDVVYFATDTHEIIVNDQAYGLSESDQTLLNNIINKVDKVEGKALSSNDYTDADKEKLDAIQQITLGEGLSLSGNVLSVNTAHYYTGTTDPDSSVGVNGDLYFLLSE